MGLLPLDETLTTLVDDQRFARSVNGSSRSQKLPETQFSFGTEIEETFENASFIRPPGFVQETEELTSLLLTTTNTENNGNNTTKSTEHECYAGIDSKFITK